MGKLKDSKSQFSMNVSRFRLIIAMTAVFFTVFSLIPSYRFASICEASGMSSSTSYPVPVGNINDYVGVLSLEEIDRLESLAQAVLEQTGVTFAVAIVDNCGDETIEMYAVNLFEKWGIGKENEDLGLLVLVSIGDREVRMEVGYGLEPIITDGIAGECLDIMIVYFSNGEYGNGLYAGLLHAAEQIAEALGIELDLQYQPEIYVPSGRNVFLWVAVIVLVAFLAFWVHLRRKERCPRCKAKLVFTDKIVQKASNNSPGIAVKVVKCPVCGYYKETIYKTRPVTSYPYGGGKVPPGTHHVPGGSYGPPRGGGSHSRSSGPKGFGGGKSGGGGASRKF
ncbi:MAG: TPM domain-containing protein [Bacillota bacterium]